MKNLWLAVTPDKYELPIFIEDTAEKLAEKLGISSNTVYSSVCKNKNGKNSGRKIIKVSIDGDQYSIQVKNDGELYKISVCNGVWDANDKTSIGSTEEVTCKKCQKIIAKADKNGCVKL